MENGEEHCYCAFRSAGSIFMRACDVDQRRKKNVFLKWHDWRTRFVRYLPVDIKRRRNFWYANESWIATISPTKTPRTISVVNLDDKLLAILHRTDIRELGEDSIFSWAKTSTASLQNRWGSQNHQYRNGRFWLSAVADEAKTKGYLSSNRKDRDQFVQFTRKENTDNHVVEGEVRKWEPKSDLLPRTTVTLFDESWVYSWVPFVV